MSKLKELRIKKENVYYRKAIRRLEKTLKKCIDAIDKGTPQGKVFESWGARTAFRLALTDVQRIEKERKWNIKN